MSTRRAISVTQKSASFIRKGDPLLVKESFPKELHFEEGEVVSLVDPQGQFVANAYLAIQNKGLGWIYSYHKEEAFDQTFFIQQFHTALARRQALLDDEMTTAFRLFNAEGDGIPGVTIDLYDSYAVFSWYSKGVYRYQAELIEAFKQVFPFVTGIYEKNRYQSDDQAASDFVEGQQAPEPLYVKENGVMYATYLDEGWMTGIFLDQRHVRQAIMERYASGKSVLNTFSYTGAFSVAAAMGGAAHTTSVDVANRSLEKTKEQFVVNGIDPDTQLIRVMDVFDYIQYAKRKSLAFDLIVVDPPSFARTKKRTFSVVKDYSKMVEDLIDISADDAIFVCSSNAANYKRDKFKADIEKAFKNKEVGCRILEEHRLPEDFPAPAASQTSQYLKVFIIQKTK
ncbi:class I SAM-dependent rRNA methyltransferase [Jeotgalibaca arthritidis]|uniref:Class I SAM-dependent rRNA methyltransferase n=1 Tax=Jeotgalibaca arthritidis TaxID=1868794 RepID=A0A6G7KAH1_9LACT|nr:class I SAM-dependent rRNA methyltransferase [Jeotgalibaca arthritidis]QII82245.1 class I SAM-dependent rRNA methyltransferase [Jeotgalibaca arthritidis]